MAERSAHESLFSFLVWNRNLSATAVKNYDGLAGRPELRAYGLDFGRFAVVFTVERRSTRVADKRWPEPWEESHDA